MTQAVPVHDSRASAPPQTYPPRSAVFGWVLFDWAAQPYFTLITTFVFAPYFASRVASDPVTGQASWGYATAAAGLVIAVLSPVLGAIADAGGHRQAGAHHRCRWPAWEAGPVSSELGPARLRAPIQRQA